VESLWLLVPVLGKYQFSGLFANFFCLTVMNDGLCSDMIYVCLVFLLHVIYL